MKRALITGITGQDGSYLAELLLSKDYEVHGIVRRASTFNTDRIDHLYQDPHVHGTRLFLHFGDMSSASELTALLAKVKPDEIYHLAAQSHVRVSFDIPEYTANVDALGTLRLLEAIKTSRIEARIYNASSSEMFGNAPAPQSETTPFHPCSPYAVSKSFAHHIAVNYRASYGMFIVNGILFNHESPRRGETFVTRKITRAVARIKAGLQSELFLGDISPKRDFGYAREYVEAMWLMLQQDKSDDYVIATGEAHTIREFLESAFSHAGLQAWDHVRFEDRYRRPVEVQFLLGDASKAKRILGWEPKTKFDALVQLMVEADMELLDKQRSGTLALEPAFA